MNKNHLINQVSRVSNADPAIWMRVNLELETEANEALPMAHQSAPQDPQAPVAGSAAAADEGSDARFLDGLHAQPAVAQLPVLPLMACAQ